jgi:hypothetical protein
MPRRDRGWWSTRERIVFTGEFCGQERDDVQTVMAYCARLDPHGEQSEQHPGWKDKGWLVLRECRWCDEQTYAETVDDETVRSWGVQLGGWTPEGFCL